MARPKSKIIKPKRARGGQPGNTNRRTHGFYARTEIEGRAHARRLYAESLYLVASFKLHGGQAAFASGTFEQGERGEGVGISGFE